MSAHFDDHLGLLERSLSDRRLIAFTGMSGSGKSTYIDALLAGHPEFRDRPVTRVGPTPIDWTSVRPTTALVVIDEVARSGEVVRLASLLAGGHTLLVASHLPERLLRLLGARWPTLALRTDGTPAKLARSLERRGITFSPDLLSHFVATYGSNYTDLDIVLEWGGGADFDVAYRRFRRTASIVRHRVARMPA